MFDLPLPSSLRDPRPLAEALDALDHEARLAWARGLPVAELDALYELVIGFRPLALADFVPADGSVVRLHGRNVAPLFNLFQKRFARVDGVVVGYNHLLGDGVFGENPRTGGFYAWFAGPGHFVAYDAPELAEIRVDYRRLPVRTHPSFPPLRGNDRGVAWVTYAWQLDLVRRVSNHVLIGDTRRYGGRVNRLLAGAKFVGVLEPEAVA